MNTAYSPPPVVDPLTEWISDTGRTFGPFCDATAYVRLDGDPEIQWCTRHSGHTGRHAAGNGRRIVAVWGDRP